MSAEAVKTCSICKETKSLEMFGKKAGRCKRCLSDRQRSYYAKNREKIAAERAANLEKHSERERSYYAKNKEKIAKRRSHDRKANPGKYVERERRYSAANREKIAEKNRRYYSANREKAKETWRRYYAALPDAIVAKKIIDGTTLTRADIPPELLEAKRLQLKLKRLAREET